MFIIIYMFVQFYILQKEEKLNFLVMLERAVEITYWECWTASNALVAGRKSLTATSLFSFFLSDTFVKVLKDHILKFLFILAHRNSKRTHHEKFINF